jgi:NAD(P)-dependent dehydrogenase (short-subunit alcohol dehydrogenase family)
MRPLDEQTILITGATDGLGQALAGDVCDASWAGTGRRPPGLVTRHRGSGRAVFRSWRASGAGGGGFRCTGRSGGLRA